MDDSDFKAASAANQSDGNVKPGAVHISGKQAHINHLRPSSSSSSNASADDSGVVETVGSDNNANIPLERKFKGGESHDVIDAGVNPSTCASKQHEHRVETKSILPTKLEDSKDINGPTSNQYYQANSRLNDDLEFGEFDTNIAGSDVAVALPVDETDLYSPTAVEYESDAKPSSNTTTGSPRFGLYLFLCLFAVIIGTTGAIIGIIRINKSAKENIPVPKSTTDIYRERVAQFVSDEVLEKVSNPYRKALDWISNHDPMLTKPDNPRFVQRYILAYIYFATSAKQPWVSDCAPSDETDKFNCVHDLKRDKETIVHRSAFKWLSDTDECKWAGIQCDLKSQIETIELGGVGMTSTFPDGVVHLPYLNAITLMFGDLEGPLPDFIGDLKALREINLSSNKFTGTIPSTWLQSRSLQSIIVESNRITGTISSSISQLYDLLELSLNENSLTGTIPKEIGDLSSLNYLLLERNSINGSIPEALGQLTHLSTLRLSSNLITGTIPMEIGHMEELKDFAVSGNLLTGKIPERFWTASNLNFVDMADNFLTGTISGKITTLSFLYQLIITNNQFTGALPARFGQTIITEIKASGNMFNGTIAPQLCDLVEIGQLEVLELDCAAPAITGTNSSAEIICPINCCTLCCAPDGKTCRSN